MPNITKLRLNEQGQTLVVIVSLMIVALSIGISVSSRYIKRLRGSVSTDLASRSLAISEAAIEHILLLPVETLEGYADTGTCGSDCLLSITGVDNVTSNAVINLTRLGNSSDPYIVDLSQDDVAQVSLGGYPSSQPIYVCWNNSAMSITALYIHGTVGSYGADAYAYNPGSSSNGSNGFDTTSSSFGYTNCFTITSKEDSRLLRLKSVYDEATAAILPAASTTLPAQGILIESEGTTGNSIRTVSVIITDPVMPAIFDYMLYQKSTTEPLSN